MIRMPRPEPLDPHVAYCIAQATGIQTARRLSPHRARTELRASSFPTCPRQYHIYRRTPPIKRPFDEDSFVSDSATLEGTALHIALQRWFGLKAPQHCYGNWVCLRCHKIRRHQVGTQYCHLCGGEMRYEEYEVKRTESIPFSGHIDMLLKDLPLNVLLDYKGSSQKKILKYRRANAPKPENYLQVNAYANAINSGEQDFGSFQKVEKVVILYLDRAEPWRNQFAIQMPVSQRVYRETLALIEQALHSLKILELPRGICTSPEDPHGFYCRWRDICWSPMITTMLDDKVYPEDTREQDREAEHYLELKTGAIL